MIGNRSIWAVVPASGVGSRMQADLPKQYLRFQGKTIIEHTLDRLFACDQLDGIVLVISPEDDYWRKLGYQPPGKLELAEGGDERVHSVLNGLSVLQASQGEDTLVLVHDAVRPLVLLQDLQHVIKAGLNSADGALLAVPVSDTLKRQDGSKAVVRETVSREGLWRAQTPQVFELSRLAQALQNSIINGNLVSDDSAAMELAGYQPVLVRGSGGNIKITLPEDLVMAEQIWLHQRDQQHDE